MSWVEKIEKLIRVGGGGGMGVYLSNFIVHSIMKLDCRPAGFLSEISWNILPFGMEEIFRYCGYGRTNLGKRSFW